MNTKVTKMKLALAGAIMALAGAATAQTPVDPPSGRIDPPPGAQDYIEQFPTGQWTFGKLLWRGPASCTPESCEAAYNASPLTLLVTKQKNCCGDPGYSVTIVGRVTNCPSSSYYLAWSTDLDRLAESERKALVARHATQIASAITGACGVANRNAIATEALDGLFD